MREYAIISDSACALSKENREKYDVDYVSLRILFDDKDLPADLDYKEVPYETFFKMLKDGVKIKTSQANVSDYIAKFEPVIKDGKDCYTLSQK